MNKLLAALIATLFSAAVFAQAPGCPATPAAPASRAKVERKDAAKTEKSMKEDKAAAAKVTRRSPRRPRRPRRRPLTREGLIGASRPTDARASGHFLSAPQS